MGHPSSIAGRIQRVSRASHGWHVDAGRDEREEKKEEGSLSLSLSLSERDAENPRRWIAGAWEHALLALSFYFYCARPPRAMWTTCATRYLSSLSSRPPAVCRSPSRPTRRDGRGNVPRFSLQICAATVSSPPRLPLLFPLRAPHRAVPIRDGSPLELRLVAIRVPTRRRPEYRE